MRRVFVNENKESIEHRTENLMHDVTKQLDNDLRRFGFRGGCVGGGADNDDMFGRILGTRSLFGTSSLVLPKPTMTPMKSDSSPADVSALKIGQDAFSVNFDLKGFEPSEILVTCEERVLGVSARKEVVVDGASSAKEFNRKVKLPSYVDPATLTSLFTPDGVLTIEAPPPQQQQSPQQQQQPQQHFPSQIEQQPQRTTQDSTIPEANTTTTAATGHRSCNDGRSVTFLTADTSASGVLPLDTPIFSESGGVRKMNLILELGPEYVPDDVTVCLEGRRLIINACRVVKGEGKSSKVSVQREFDLSEDIEAASVEAELRGGGGRLNISALVEKKGKCRVVVV